MAINIFSQNNNDKHDKSLLIYILQIVAIYNAIMDGWKVKKIGIRKYELSKKINTSEDIELNYFLKKLVECSNL